MNLKEMAMAMGAAFCGLSVVLGAFAAHALRESLTVHEIEIFRLGATYQMYHGLALLILGLSGIATRSVVILMGGGVLIFSGSLYLLAILHMPKLGMITPIGGSLLIISWVIVVIQMLKSRGRNITE